MVFDGVVDKVGQLPPDVVGEVVFLYRYFHELNKLPSVYTGYVDDLRDVEKGYVARKQQIENEIQSCVSVFNSYIDKAINRANIVQPMLLKSAFPWWSPRRWRRRPSKQLTLEEAAQRADDALAHRASIAAGLRRRKST